MRQVAAISQARFDVEQVRRKGLHEFVKRAWHQIDPATFRDNWHIALMCTYLERLFRGEIRKLAIMVPPGSSKSLICQVLWPAWCWIQDPAEKFIFSTFEAKLCWKFGRRQRDLVMGDWFQERWPHVRITKSESQAAGLVETSSMGMRFSTGIGGAVTGTHGGILACDDPNKAQAAMGTSGATLTELLQARDYWNKILPTRQVDPQTTRRLLLQQCLHWEDVINDWIRNDPEVTVLCLPAEYDAGHPFVCSEDPRTEDGELLWPEHVPAEQIAELKRTLGPMDYAAQYQQSPGRAGGEVFRLDWLSHYWKMIRKYDIITGLISCDLTFGGKRDNASYIALGVWALVGTKACLVDQVRTRASYLETRSLIKVLAAKYPWARPVLVENKANGPAVLEDLKREIAGMVPHEPKGSKLARAHAVTGYFEAGDVLLPDPQGAIIDGQRVDTSWVADYVLELNRFTGSDADVSDQVDQTSQALSRFYQGPARSFVDAMSGIARDLGFA